MSGLVAPVEKDQIGCAQDLEVEGALFGLGVRVGLVVVDVCGYVLGTKSVELE